MDLRVIEVFRTSVERRRFERLASELGVGFNYRSRVGRYMERLAQGYTALQASGASDEQLQRRLTLIRVAGRKLGVELNAGAPRSVHRRGGPWQLRFNRMIDRALRE